MWVSLRPRCITHYRNSVGLISTRCGKLMDRLSQSSQPLQFYRLVAPRSAALQPHYRVQCPYRWKLFHFTTAPPKNSLPSRVNRRRTMHSHRFCWNATLYSFCSCVSDKSRCDEYQCDARSWTLSEIRTCDSVICIDTWDRRMIYREASHKKRLPFPSHILFWFPQ